MLRRGIVLLAMQAPMAHGWTTAHLRPNHNSVVLRAHIHLQVPTESSDDTTFRPAAATGEDTPKTDGIPNYMIRTFGSVSRLAEGPTSSTEVQDDGVHYEIDRLVSLVTSDVIDMVQQQGGAAEKVDHLGENILVEGMLFDSFEVDDVFEISDATDADADVVALEIVEPRPASAVELGQLGEDAAARQSIASMVSLAPGFSGWTARVVAAGQVQAGFKIAKREAEEEK